MAKTLQGKITETGMSQGDIVKVLENMRDVINELITDHATNRTAIAANKTATNAIITAAATNIAAVAAVSAVSSSPAATLTNSTPITLG